MKKVSLVVLLGCVFLESGCVSTDSAGGLVVYIIDTIGGRRHIVSAEVGEDGMFANSRSKGKMTQTISGEVTESGDKYIVAIDYNCIRTDRPGTRQLRTRVLLEEGQLFELGGMDKDITRIKIEK